MFKPVGETRAEDDEKLPRVFFGKSRVFEDIFDPSCFFICGRRGSGKTATCYAFEPVPGFDEKPKWRQCRYYTALTRHDFYRGLARDLSHLKEASQTFSSAVDVGYTFELLWQLLIWVSIMQDIIQRSPEEEGCDVIKEYLGQRGYKEKSALAIVRDTVASYMSRGEKTAGQVLAAILDISKELSDQTFIKAKEKASRLLSRHGGMVVIDTLDDFFVGEKSLGQAVNGMLQAVLALKEDRLASGLQIKCFLPAEVYPHLDIINPRKVRDHTAFLHWHYGHLLSMICKRYETYLFDNGLSELDPAKVEWQDSDFVRANVLERYFPTNVTDRLRIWEPCMQYVVRHTHKKPSELILLFNAILDEAKKEGTFPKVKEHHVLVGTHRETRLLAEDNLAAHAERYGSVRDIIYQLLGQTSNILFGKDIDKKLARIAPTREQAGLTRLEVYRLLLEAGIVGLVTEKHERSDGAKVYSVAYEYNIKDILHIEPDSECAIHPMYYQSFLTVPEPMVLVYPHPTEEEEFGMEPLW